MNPGRGQTALIGYTGFVGGALRRATAFDCLFNSGNVTDMVGRSFDLIVCAGLPAAKWRANNDPEADRANMLKLSKVLEGVNAREFILISTIDVYPDPSLPLDEDSIIHFERNTFYGRHRYEFEEFVRSRFPLVRIIRLAALFGTGLKKNALYDLLHDNLLANINPAAIFQWYPTRRLATDIELIRTENLFLVNLFTEPLAMSQIIDAFFPNVVVGPSREPAPHYALKTRHGRLFGGDDSYAINSGSLLKELARYIMAVRATLQ
jgi:hypothetical protein